MALPPSLVRRTKPHPDESLVSYLIRLSIINFCRRYTTFFNAIRRWIKRNGGRTIDDLSCPYTTTTLQVLEALTKQEINQLLLLSPHKYANFFNKENIWATKTTVSIKKRNIVSELYEEALLLDDKVLYSPAFFRSFANGQYCPQCLAENAYHRLEWMLFPICVCSKHKCLLLDKCQTCCKNLSIHEIIKRKCKECRMDLRQAKVIDLSNDSIGITAQQSILSWIGQKSQILTNDLAFPKASNYVLFQIMKGIYETLDKKTVLTDSVPHAELIEENLWIKDQLKKFLGYKLAFQALTSWPESFLRYLDLYLAEYKEDSTNNPQKLLEIFGRFFSVCINKRLAFSEYEFLTYEFFNYLPKKLKFLTDGMLGPSDLAHWLNIRKQFLFITDKLAQGLLEVPENYFRFLKFNCFMNRLTNSEEAPEGWIHQESVLYVHDIFMNESILAEDCAELLGVDVADAQQLIDSNDMIDTEQIIDFGGDSNTINEERGGEISIKPRLTGKWVLHFLYSLFSVAKGYNRLTPVLGSTEDITELGYMRIYDAVEFLEYNGSKMRLIHLLRLINKGAIKTIYSDEVPRKVKNLYVDRVTIEKLIPVKPSGPDWLSYIEATGSLRIPPDYLNELVEYGFIAIAGRLGNNVYFAKDEIEEFRTKYVYLYEASKILSVPLSSIKRNFEKNEELLLSLPNNEKLLLIKRRDLEKISV